jgi:hypothetical protein
MLFYFYSVSTSSDGLIYLPHRLIIHWNGMAYHTQLNLMGKAYLGFRPFYRFLQENLRSQNDFAMLSRKSVKKVVTTQYKNNSPLNLCLEDVGILLKHVTLSNKQCDCTYLMNLASLSLQRKYVSQT